VLSRFDCGAIDRLDRIGLIRREQRTVRKILITSSFAATIAAVCFAVVCFGIADEKVRFTGEPAAKSGSTRVAANASSAGSAVPDQIHDLAARLTKAFNQRDATAFAAVFTNEGDYIDETGSAFHGRHAIEEEFKKLFASGPEAKIRVQFETPHLVATGVVSAEGQTKFQRTASEQPVSGRCSAIIVTEGSHLQIATLRELAAETHSASHREQVSQLGWMIGDWIAEGSSYHVHFSCRWDETGNYLLRDFSVNMGGQQVSSGAQRIGYDPQAGHLKSWTFDSTGAFSDGYIHRDGEHWTLHSSGVTADGHMASGTNVFTRIDDHRLIWQALDCIVDGERIADTGQIAIVRKPPAPKSRSR
jgi:uncharacterized protein (TIGR02246 family)